MLLILLVSTRLTWIGYFVVKIRPPIKEGTVAEWSRALVQNHLEWTVPSSNPGEGCYGDGELSGSGIALFPHMAIC